MRDESIARSYSEALLALARKANAATEWGKLINAVASAIENDLMLRRFLAAPQISGDQKIAVIGKALYLGSLSLADAHDAAALRRQT